MGLSHFIRAQYCYTPLEDDLRIHRLDFAVTADAMALFDAAGLVLPAVVAGAVPKRQADYLAGRLAARAALADWGCHLPVGMGAAREPLWPEGFVGAISHQGGSAVAMAVPSCHARGVGLDLEGWLAPDSAMAIWPGILTASERQRLADLPLSWPEQVTLIFSAKESLFKALHPAVGRYFDFLDAAVLALDVRRQRFVLQLQVTLTPDLPAGMTFEGRWHAEGGQVLTGIISHHVYKI